MMVRRKRTKEMESCPLMTAVVLVKDWSSFVLLRQPRRWKVDGVKIFKQKSPQDRMTVG